MCAKQINSRKFNKICILDCEEFSLLVSIILFDSLHINRNITPSIFRVGRMRIYVIEFTGALFKKS
jgi:hypothetical protein